MNSLPMIYHFDWRGLEEFTEYLFDDNGLPQVNYGKHIGLRYNAITISQYGLYHISRWGKYKNEQSKELAIKCADWLIENVNDWHHNTKAWIFDFKLPLYGPQPPWISGMAQGEAVSLLLRAYLIHKNELYLQTARQAIKVFQYKVTDFGVVEYLEDGLVVFQEYPAVPAPHVLNGHVFALFGVYDYGVFFNDPAMINLADKGAQTLLQHWEKWDAGFWTRYDLYKVKRLTSPMYHELHVRQMRVLANLFDENKFTIIANRWENMQHNVFCKLRWLMTKIVEKVYLRFKSSQL